MNARSATVKTIGQCAFLGLETLQHIVILGDDVSIANSAFDAVAPSNLERVLLPDIVTKIGDQSFGHFSSLKRMIIPYGSLLIIRFPDYGLYAASREVNGKPCLIMQTANSSNLYYHIDEVLSSLDNVSSGLPVLYDISGKQPLDWDMLLEKIEGRSLTTTIKLRIGIDFTLDDTGKIYFSENIATDVPWLQYNPDCYISSVPEGCQIYIRNNHLPEDNNTESDHINQLYIEDISSIINHCISDVDVYINRGEMQTANAIIEILLQLLTAKEKVLPATYCHAIQDRLNITLNTLANNP